MIKAQDRCRWCLRIMDSMVVLLNPAYTWNPTVRRAYVLLWPAAIVLRSLCFVILVAIILIAAWVCTAWVYFEGVWKGEDVRW